MKSASEVLKSKNEKIQQKIKDDSELINIELLEVEKILNKYESDTDDTKPYITVPLIIKSQTVKDLLIKEGYVIDRISNNIEVNTTRIYLSKTDYDIAIATRRKYTGNTFSDYNKITELETEDNKLLDLDALGLINLIKSIDKLRYRAGY